MRRSCPQSAELTEKRIGKCFNKTKSGLCGKTIRICRAGAQARKAEQGRAHELPSISHGDRPPVFTIAIPPVKIWGSKMTSLKAETKKTFCFCAKIPFFRQGPQHFSLWLKHLALVPSSRQLNGGTNQPPQAIKLKLR